MEKPAFTIANRSLAEWLSSLPTLAILLITIFFGAGEIIHSQLLKIGENTWDEYYLLRTAGSLPTPTCEKNPNIDQRVEEAVKKAEEAAANDPFAGILGSTVDPAAIRTSIIQAAEICKTKWEKYELVQERVTPSVKAFRTLEAGVSHIVLFLSDQQRLLLCLLILICACVTTLGRHHIALRPIESKQDYTYATVSMLAANLLLLFSSIMYRAQELKSMEQGVLVAGFELHKFWIAGFTILSIINIVQLIKPPKDLTDGKSVGRALLAIPLFAYMGIITSLNYWVLPWLMHQLPFLASLMGVAEVKDPYYTGMSVYLAQIMELSYLFLKLALYIFIGMMLKQTRLTQLTFNVFRPWNMSPELLCFVVLFFAAVPTAYTGASGIFVIAAGSIIYSELRRGGARPQLALATTAMSGSMGVVLRPCLLVVIIAALNNEVTTDELFSSGLKVFLLSAFLFLIVSQFAKTEPTRIESPAKALPASARALLPLIPYIILMTSIIVAFNDLLARRLDEFLAPVMLPIFLLLVIGYEKLSRWIADFMFALLAVLTVISFYQLMVHSTGPADMEWQGALDTGTTLARNLFATLLLILYPLCRKEAHQAVAHDQDSNEDQANNVESAVRLATNETTGHIGALLFLMAMSISVGGIIERSGMMESLPETFSSVWVAASLLVVVLVIIGMIMDPYGAVILVNATIAGVAVKNGIDPLHFWMITLVAFELGYLTPPVALNHLLTRQVVGEAEIEAAKIKGGSFWVRYEKYLLPITVMATALLMVAFLPLMSDGLHDWIFQRISHK